MATRKKMQQSSEEARHKPFQALQLELQEAGYLEQNITFSSTRAITLGLLCALSFVALWGVIYRLFLIDRAQLSDAEGMAFYIMVLVIVAVSVFVHELLHGLGWAIFGKKGWTAIHFNINALMPTCTCQAALTKRQSLSFMYSCNAHRNMAQVFSGLERSICGHVWNSCKVAGIMFNVTGIFLSPFFQKRLKICVLVVWTPSVSLRRT